MKVRRLFLIVALIVGGLVGTMSVSVSALPAAPPSPVTTGFATISNLSINGVAETTATVAPGSTVAIRATVTDSHPGYCPDCVDFVPIGLAGAAAPAGCLENAGRDGSVQTNTVDVTAPSTAGSYDVVAESNYVYYCSQGWGGTGTTIAVLTVPKEPTMTTESCTPPNPPAVNQSVTCTATVTPAVSDSTPVTGTVTFYDQGTAVATVPLVNGQASYTALYSVSGHSLYAVYNGDDNYLTSTSNTVAITSPCTTTYTGTHSSLTVTSGTTCLIDATITGGITVTRGAVLDVENSTVRGSVTASYPANVRICGSTTGAIAVASATGSVVIGDPSSNCAPNTINGGLVAASNTGGGTISGNAITGSWTITNNTPPFTVTGNHH